MADASNREEWKKIAAAITKETDPRKVSELVQKLLDSFDRSLRSMNQSAAD